MLLIVPTKSLFDRSGNSGSSTTGKQKYWQPGFPFFFSVGMIFFWLVVPQVCSMDWETATVDSTGNVGQYTSLCLDSSGNPRISYYDATNRALKYVSWDGSAWQKTTVDKKAGITVGLYTSLALDSSGKPYIGYYNSTAGALKYAVLSTSEWTTTVVDNSVLLSEGIPPSLKVDSSGRPHIAYYSPSRSALVYASWDGAAWQTADIDSSGSNDMHVSLSLGSDDNPHVSYYNSTSKDLEYAYSDGAAWHREAVDSPGDVGQYSALALNASGFPDISYYDETNGDLKYAAWDGSAWQKETVDDAGIVGKYTSLALDADGAPMISYYDLTHQTLKFAYWNGISWQKETIDTSSANIGQYTSLARDDAGNPHISYYDVINRDLKYTHGYFPVTTIFSATPVTGTAPLTVQFTDSSTRGLPSGWNWSFGDGSWFNTTLSADRNPLHTYTEPGAYTVNLSVQNFTVAGSLSRSGYITVSAPPTTTVQTPAIPPSQPDTGSSSYESNEIQQERVQPDIPPLAESSQTVNVGGDSVIQHVTVTGQDVSGVVITAMTLSSLPKDVPPVGAPVYHYIDVTPAHFGTISAAQIDFYVPLTLIEEQHITHDDIELNRFNEGVWTSLITDSLKVQNGQVFYRAESPGFSLMAIVIVRNTTVGVPVMAQHDTVVPVETSQIIETPPVTPTTLQIPLPLPEHPTSVPTISPRGNDQLTFILLCFLPGVCIAACGIFGYMVWKRKTFRD
jgi:PGF-pre-PGF domain-containing protein